MEALIAVGLAGNVVQFLQAAGTLISVAKAMRSDGKKRGEDALPDIYKLSETIRDQVGVLKKRLWACGATLAEEDQNLLNVARECDEAATAFIEYLKSKIDRTSKSVGSTIKLAMKLAWSSPKIDGFILRLDRLRNSLTLATVLALRTSAEGDNRQVLAHLRTIQQEQQAQKMDGERLQSTIESLFKAVQDEAGNTCNALQKEIQFCLSEINALRNNMSLAGQTHGLERDILNWLDFRQISWRYDGIHSAYQETYRWIFDRPDCNNDWDNFAHHLEGDTVKPYFISGKAGSGKSTLMKFIHDNPQTTTSLKRWAGANELVILHFFFWNLGTSLQKSQAGMLRALLHAMLERFPELIPAVLPRHYRNWKSFDADTEPDYIEVKTTFELMIEKSPYLNLAILIDGIDEFEGDHRDMLLFLRSIVSHRVKLVVSSRPINTCLEVLADCPTLRLQDLTRNDMAAYVHGELTSHRLMVRLSQQFPERAPNLSNELVEKAEGVFLWIKLVVRLLVEGLENGDDLAELETRLAALPSDLRDLYKRMFAKMQGAYRKQAASIFQLLRTWDDNIPDESLPGLVLSYAICSPMIVFDTNNALMTKEVFNWTMDSLGKRIRSRCCGLLELRYDNGTLHRWPADTSLKDTLAIQDVNRSRVTYLHRSVAEFIKADEVWQEICELTHGLLFDAHTNLASACIFPIKLGRNFDGNIVKRYVACTALFLRKAKDVSRAMANKYLLEVDRTMSKMLLADPGSPKQHWSARMLNVTLIASYNASQQDANIFSFAAGETLFGLPIDIPVDLSTETRVAIVLYALSSWLKKSKRFGFQRVSVQERTKSLAYLYRNVSPPDSISYGSSLWHHALAVCDKLVNDEEFLEAAYLIKTSLAAAEYPQRLWNEHVLTGHTAPDILASLRRSLSITPDQEFSDALNEIARLQTLTWNNVTESADAMGTQRERRPSGKEGAKPKKSRRAKKLKFRAGG